MKASVVDLFCGAGGLTHGFVLEGFVVNAGIDIDPACQYPYEHNNGTEFIQDDLANITGGFLSNLYPEDDVKILAGCAPCQPFSTYTQGQSPRKSSKWQMLQTFAELVTATMPAVITMENVVSLTKHPTYTKFKRSLKKQGYYFTEYKVYCPDYGIPQRRKRLVVFASLYQPLALAPPSHSPESYVTVRDTIDSLPPIEAGEFHDSDPLHKSSNLSDLNLRRIKASRPGGTWKDWDKDLVAECHRRDSGKTYGGVYARMEWDKPSPTITTQCHGFGNGRFGHPSQDRAISLREAALLQTFPEEYKFATRGAPIEFSTIGRLIGNAVPVKLGQVIAHSIKSHLEVQCA